MSSRRALPPRDATRRMAQEDWEQTRLARDFYARGVLTVARECIGKVLIHVSPEGLVAGRIVEAEAYRGPEDLAAHSARGRRTARNEPMWGPPGHAYVFFVYGMHWHLNLVTGGEGEPHAVLIRGVEPIEGLEEMARRRGMAADRRELTNGPGKLCVAFGVDRRHDRSDLCAGPLFLADGPPTRATRARRIGIDYAGAWALKRWRFLEPGNPYVSRPAEATLRRR